MLCCIASGSYYNTLENVKISVLAGSPPSLIHTVNSALASARGGTNLSSLESLLF